MAILAILSRPPAHLNDTPAGPLPGRIGPPGKTQVRSIFIFILFGMSVLRRPLHQLRGLRQSPIEAPALTDRARDGRRVDLRCPSPVSSKRGQKRARRRVNGEIGWRAHGTGFGKPSSFSASILPWLCIGAASPDAPTPKRKTQHEPSMFWSPTWTPGTNDHPTALHHWVAARAAMGREQLRGGSFGTR